MIILSEDGDRPKSESGSAAMSPMGMNLIVVRHAFARMMATAEDRPRSLN
jgi:phosphohistidine phosphatase SixA